MPNDYRLDNVRGRVAGCVDGAALVRQRVLKILATPRGEYAVYPADFGVTFLDLYGEDPAYVAAESAERVKNALAPYGYTVTDFAARYARGSVYLNFTAEYDGGTVDIAAAG